MILNDSRPYYILHGRGIDSRNRCVGRNNAFRRDVDRSYSTSYKGTIQCMGGFLLSRPVLAGLSIIRMHKIMNALQPFSLHMHIDPFSPTVAPSLSANEYLGHGQPGEIRKR